MQQNIVSKVDKCLSELDQFSSSKSIMLSDGTMAAAPETMEELRERLIKDKIDYIRFDSVDMNGRVFGRMIPVRHFDSVTKSGVCWFVGSWFLTSNYGITGDTSKYRHCNVHNFAVPNTYAVLSHYNENNVAIARVFTYPRLPNDLLFKNELFDFIEPRLLCNKQLNILSNEFNLSVLSAIEHEFQVVSKSDKINDAKKEEWLPLWNGKQMLRQSVLLNPKYSKFLFECEETLYKSMNVDVESLQTEYSPGQFEWVLKPQWGVKACDNSSTFRNTVKEIANKHGFMATFAAIPFPDKIDGAANGGHFNLSLWYNDKDKQESDSKGKDEENNSGTRGSGSSKKNAFFSPKVNKEGNHQLSDLCLHFIGGILAHIEGLTAFANANVNCYRRSNNHSWAPGNGTWSLHNRSVCIRCKNNPNDESGTHIEFRAPTAAANPYLVMTSVLAAGIDGIKNKISPGMPCDEYAFADGWEKKYKAIPDTIEKAMDALKNDKVLVNAFGELFIEWYVNAKLLETKELNDKAKLLNSKEKAETEMFLDL